ncbi:MAG: DUF4157 domain-containing protein [Jatrophihabitans sp.]
MQARPELVTVDPLHLADPAQVEPVGVAPTRAPQKLSQESERLALPGLALPESEQSVRRRESAGGADPLGGTAVDTATAQRLASPSGGRSLNPELRTPLESAFGADFGAVNVHTDENAAQLARDVQATAFTHGNNIFFAQGAYAPGSARGQHLLAHELTHVVQQQQGRGGRGSGSTPTIGRADDPAEAEAEDTARDVVGSLQRQAAHCGQPDHDHNSHEQA